MFTKVGSSKKTKTGKQVTTVRLRCSGHPEHWRRQQTNASANKRLDAVSELPPLNQCLAKVLPDQYRKKTRTIAFIFVKNRRPS